MEDRVRQGQDALLAHVVPEISREGHPRTRVRLGAHEDAIAAARVTRMAHHRTDVFRVADMLEDAGAEPVGDQQIQRHLGGRAGVRRSEVGDGPTDAVAE